MGFGFGRNNFLGQQVLYDGSEGTLIHSAAKGGPGGGHGGRPGGGGTTPSPTVVGSSTGFQFDLMWDSSVSNAPSGFMSAVTNTASYLASLFSNREVVNVHIGWGAVNSQTLSAGALGESQTNGYLTDYA